MAKYLVETYYNCTFKVSHYLDEINENELNKLEKREDGKFEILDLTLENRKTKNLDGKKSENIQEIKEETPKTNITNASNTKVTKNDNLSKIVTEKLGKRRIQERGRVGEKRIWLVVDPSYIIYSTRGN